MIHLLKININNIYINFNIADFDFFSGTPATSMYFTLISSNILSYSSGSATDPLTLKNRS